MQALKKNPERGKNRLQIEYLRAQREELLVYLDILDRMGAAVGGGEADRLQRYAELESACIARLEKLRRTYAGLFPPGKVPPRQASLASLGREALKRNAAVRKALADMMAELRLRIDSRPACGRRGSAHRPSPYAGIGEPSLVDTQS